MITSSPYSSGPLGRRPPFFKPGDRVKVFGAALSVAVTGRWEAATVISIEQHPHGPSYDFYTIAADMRPLSHGIVRAERLAPLDLLSELALLDKGDGVGHGDHDHERAFFGKWS